MLRRSVVADTNQWVTCAIRPHEQRREFLHLMQLPSLRTPIILVPACPMGRREAMRRTIPFPLTGCP